MTDFKKFKEKQPSKEKFYSLLTGKKIVAKNMIDDRLSRFVFKI